MVYDKVTWWLKGRSHFTQSKHVEKAKHFESEALNVNLEGKIAVIFGGDQGLGKATARELANRGATIHIVCKSKKKGEEAIKSLMEDSNRQDADSFQLHIHNLTDMTELNTFIREYKETVGKCHILVFAASDMPSMWFDTSYKIQSGFALNTLAFYIIITEFQEMLKACAPSRVINVASTGLFIARLHEEDPQRIRYQSSYDKEKNFAIQKRQQTELMMRWGNDSSNTNAQVAFYSVVPGWVLNEDVDDYLPTTFKLKSNWRTMDQGMDTILWAAVSSTALNCKNGCLLLDRSPCFYHLSLANTTSSPAQVNKLIDTLDKMKAKFFLGREDTVVPDPLVPMKPATAAAPVAAEKAQNEPVPAEEATKENGTPAPAAAAAAAVENGSGTEKEATSSPDAVPAAGKTPTPPAKTPTPPAKTPTPPAKTPTPTAKSPTPPAKTPTPPAKTPTPSSQDKKQGSKASPSPAASPSPKPSKSPESTKDQASTSGKDA